jgi:hypothetical protein
MQNPIDRSAHSAEKTFEVGRLKRIYYADATLVVDDRDAFDEGGPKHEVRYLECRAAVEDDRVGGHHVRD